MKTRKIFFLTMTLMAIVSFAFQTTKRKSKLPRELRDIKIVEYIPAGEYRMGETKSEISDFYLFKREVTNKDYRDFLYALKRDGRKADYEIAMPDTLLWDKLDGHYKPFTEKYFSHPAYRNYPVVNVSKEAALMYCEWLTRFWNSQQNTYTLTFRLPTEKEWEYSAAAGKDISQALYPWNGSSAKDENGEVLANYKEKNGIGPTTSGKFEPNEWELYNMSGNVAEIISDKDIVKGGSWKSQAEEIQITSSEEVKVSPFVGFRPVMTFVKNN